MILVALGGWLAGTPPPTTAPPTTVPPTTVPYGAAETWFETTPWAAGFVCACILAVTLALRSGGEVKGL